MQRFTRQELYDLVWSKPMSKLAAEFGMSDVGFKKHCKKSDIPVPDRGYWAKLGSGKRVQQPPLPPKRPGERDEVVIHRRPPKPAMPLVPTQQASPPAQPQTPDDIVRLIERERLAIGQLIVVKTLTNPHSIVAGWIEEDRRRKEERRRNPWFGNSLESDNALENRKRRILSVLFKALERRGCKIVLDRERAALAGVQVGQQEVRFELSEIVRQIRRPLTTDEKKEHWNADAKWRQERIKTGKLKFSFKDSLGGWYRSEWSDDDDTAIETKLSDIAIGFAVAGERLLRVAIRREEEARLQHKQEMERWDRQRKREEEQKRAQGLMQRVEEWQAALEIRNYVEAVRNVSGLDAEAVRSWAEWALARADELDPIAAGRPIDLTYREEPQSQYGQLRGGQFAGGHFAGLAFWRR